MLHLADNLIAKIAEDIHSGWTVFVHKQTQELVMYPKDNYHTDTAEMQAEYDKIQRNSNNYLQISPMAGNEVYPILEYFIKNSGIYVLDKELDKYKGQLGKLRRAIQDSNYSEKWYNFLRNAQIAHTKGQLEML